MIPLSTRWSWLVRQHGAQLEEFVTHVDVIAEIPNSVRKGTEVKLGNVTIAD